MPPILIGPMCPPRALKTPQGPSYRFLEAFQTPVETPR